MAAGSSRWPQTANHQGVRFEDKWFQTSPRSPNITIQALLLDRTMPTISIGKRLPACMQRQALSGAPEVAIRVLSRAGVDAAWRLRDETKDRPRTAAHCQELMAETWSRRSAETRRADHRVSKHLGVVSEGGATAGFYSQRRDEAGEPQWPRPWPCHATLPFSQNVFNQIT